MKDGSHLDDIKTIRRILVLQVYQNKDENMNESLETMREVELKVQTMGGDVYHTCDVDAFDVVGVHADQPQCRLRPDPFGKLWVEAGRHHLGLCHSYRWYEFCHSLPRGSADGELRFDPSPLLLFFFRLCVRVGVEHAPPLLHTIDGAFPARFIYSQVSGK